MNKKLVVIFGILFVLSSCSSVIRNASNDSHFELCKNFDFDKKFPGKDGRPVAVHYDIDRKIISDKDGAEYVLSFGGKKKLKGWFQEDLELSVNEKKYIDCYRNREKEFDTKYAGEIKKNY